jgi:hypothetical protein
MIYVLSNKEERRSRENFQQCGMHRDILVPRLFHRKKLKLIEK